MFQLENRYQDSGWETLGRKYCYSSVDEAIPVAYRCGEDAISFGMIRIIDTEKKEVVITYPAGHTNKLKGSTIKFICPECNKEVDGCKSYHYDEHGRHWHDACWANYKFKLKIEEEAREKNMLKR